MSTGRSLITEREAEILELGPDSEEISANHYYNVRHRIRERLEELPDDIQVLREHYPEAAEELQDRLQPEKQPA